MYILVGFLVVGLICNLLERPVNPKYFMSEAELAEERRLAHERTVADEASRAGGVAAKPTTSGRIVLAWLLVGIPLAWGVYKTLASAARIFH
jgi:hypothetical protein